MAISVKLKLILYIVFLFYSRFANAQSFFNYKDDKGQKQGYWIKKGQKDYNKQFVYLKYYIDDEPKAEWVFSEDCKCLISKTSECCYESYYKETNLIKSRTEYFKDRTIEINYFRNGRTLSINIYRPRSLFGFEMIIQSQNYDSLGYITKELSLIKEITYTHAQRKIFSPNVEDYDNYGYLYEEKTYNQGLLQLKHYKILFLGKYENFTFPYGTWQYFSEKGKLIKEEFYDKGKLIKTKEYKP